MNTGSTTVAASTDRGASTVLQRSSSESLPPYPIDEADVTVEHPSSPPYGSNASLVEEENEEEGEEKDEEEVKGKEEE